MIKGEYEKESKHDCRELVSAREKERNVERGEMEGRDRDLPAHSNSCTVST